MAKRASSTQSRKDSSAVGLAEHLSASAQQHLAGLRRTLDSRLAALEAVLADPTRGESLAGLILDLSQVATQEAQAAASEACIATRAEADKELAAFRISAKAAVDAAQESLKSAQLSLEHERATSADLRRELEQAASENRRHSELLAGMEQAETGWRTERDRLDAETARQKSIATDLQRAAGDLQRALDQAALENRKQAGLLAAKEKAEAEWRIERERFEAEIDRQKSIAAEIQRTAGEHQRAMADAERQLEKERRSSNEARTGLAAERAVSTELRQATESAAARIAALEAALEGDRSEIRQTAESTAARIAALEVALEDERSAHEAALADLADAREAHKATVAALAREREAAGQHERVRAELQAQLEDNRSADETAALQKSLAETRAALAATQETLEAERRSATELRQAAELADQQVASVRSNEAQAVADYQKMTAQLESALGERDRLIDELSAARAWINELREAEAEFATASAKPPVPAAPPAPAPTDPPVPPPPAAFAQKVEPETSWQPVRLAGRHAFESEVVVQVNGDPARLSDISTSGCQLLSPTALKPNQIVKVLLPSPKAPLVCAGKVVWTRLEPMAPGQPLGYRAGVKFSKPDESAIEAFVAFQSKLT